MADSLPTATGQASGSAGSPVTPAAPATASAPGVVAAGDGLASGQLVGFGPLDAADYIDSEVMDEELRRRERERFYMLPDGTGASRPVRAERLEPPEEPGEAAPERPAPVPASLAWRACGAGPALPAVTLRADGRHVMAFPALRGDRRYAGYAVPRVPDARSLRVRTVIRDGAAVEPLVVALDAEGRAVAVLYNAVTETLPETPFRYAMLETEVPWLPSLNATTLAVFDAALARGWLPADCRPPPGLPPGMAPAGRGTITLEFLDRAGPE